MKDIKGYEGLYAITEDGRVFKYKGNKYMKINKRKDGYCSVGLTKNKKNKKFLVHRLVAMSFIPNPDNKPQINHINMIKSDNRVENLEWVTQSENIKHSYKNNKNYRFNLSKSRSGITFTDEHKRKISLSHKGKKKNYDVWNKGINFGNRKVICIETGEIFQSILQASKRYKCNVSQCLRGKSKTAGGYHWIYLGETNYGY